MAWKPQKIGILDFARSSEMGSFYASLLVIAVGIDFVLLAFDLIAGFIYSGQTCTSYEEEKHQENEDSCSRFLQHLAPCPGKGH